MAKFLDARLDAVMDLIYLKLRLHCAVEILHLLKTMRSDRGWKLKVPLVALPLPVPLAPLPPLPPLALLLPMPMSPLLVQFPPLLLQLSPAATNGAPGGPLLLVKLEDEEGGSLPEDGYALGESMYGENTPKAGGSSRRGSAVPKGVKLLFVKRIKHPGLRTRLLANGQIMHTHGCIKCWARLKLGYVSTSACTTVTRPARRQN